MFHHGRGVENNPTEARKWYKKSAELNVDCWWGMRMYAKYLIKGIGGPADQRKGFDCLVKASQGGDKPAKQIIEKMKNTFTL